MLVIAAWIFGASLYSVSIGLSIMFQDQHPFLDRFCIFSACNKNLRIPFIYFFTVSTDAVFVSLFLYYTIQAYIILEKNIFKQTTEPRGRFVSMLIMFRAGRVFVSELFFRLLLYFLIFPRIVSLAMNENCFLVFMVFLSINIILSNVMNVI